MLGLRVLWWGTWECHMVFEYPNSSLIENVVYVASLKWFVFVFVCVIVIVIVIARLYLMLCVPTLQHIWYITSLEGVKQIFAIGVLWREKMMKFLFSVPPTTDNTMWTIFQIVSIAGKEFSISKAKHWKLQKKMATHFLKLYLALKPIL